MGDFLIFVWGLFLLMMSYCWVRAGYELYTEAKENGREEIPKIPLLVVTLIPAIVAGSYGVFFMIDPFFLNTLK